jgi:hypothetical protein
MTDARYPERWLTDRRVLQLSDGGYRLFVTALAWAVANRTDGVLYDEDLTLMPKADASHADEVAKSGLWNRELDRWLIVDFVDTQTPRDQLEGLDRKRRQDRQRARRYRESHRSSRDESRDESRDDKGQARRGEDEGFIDSINRDTSLLEKNIFTDKEELTTRTHARRALAEMGYRTYPSQPPY